MNIIGAIYNPINGFLLNHIENIGFILISLVYIFFWKYIFLFLERIFRGLTFSFFEDKPFFMGLIKAIDSFIIFVLSVVLVIPLIRIVLQKYITPLLDTKYLLIVVLVFFTLFYLYFYLVYSRHYLGKT